jgi:hypothetical protein
MRQNSKHSNCQNPLPQSFCNILHEQEISYEMSHLSTITNKSSSPPHQSLLTVSISTSPLSLLSASEKSYLEDTADVNAPIKVAVTTEKYV